MNQVLIIHPEGNALNNPTLSALLDALSENEIRATVLSQRWAGRDPGGNEKVSWLVERRIWSKIKGVCINRLASPALARLIGWIERWMLRGLDCGLVIGVDRQGLIEASYLARAAHVPHAFISFEIMFASETSRSFKRLETEASRNVAFWVVQDEVRARQLQRENRLDESAKIILPLAARGRPQPPGERLRDRLGIPAHKRVAIMMGSMAAWTMADTVLSGLRNWPKDWVLIAHGRYGNTHEQLDRLFPAWRELHGRSLFVSDHPAEDVAQMSVVLAGVDYGIAFYRPVSGHPYLGNNLTYLGMASGKIATYLRHGVPLLVHGAGTIEAEVKRFGLGRIVPDPARLASLLAESRHDYERDRLGAYFLNRLDFDRFSTPLLEAIRIRLRGCRCARKVSAA